MNKDTNANCKTDLRDCIKPLDILSQYPKRYIDLESEPDQKKTPIEICRFHNYDSNQGCIRLKRGWCKLDHEHCHRCLQKGHKAYECTKTNQKPEEAFSGSERDSFSKFTNPFSSPHLCIIGGRLRGKTMNQCEALNLKNLESNVNEWLPLPSLNQNRGSHGVVAPLNSNLILTLGGGGIDGNLNSIEILASELCDNSANNQSLSDDKGNALKWKVISSESESRSISSTPQSASIPPMPIACHALEVVSLDNTIYTIGGWKYGTQAVKEVYSLKLNTNCAVKSDTQSQQQWISCPSLQTARRLHSAVCYKKKLYVFGGHITSSQAPTASVECLDLSSLSSEDSVSVSDSKQTSTWKYCRPMPYEAQTADSNGSTSGSSPLVQAVATTQNGIWIFPFGSDGGKIYRYHPKENPMKDDYYEEVLVKTGSPDSDGASSSLSLPISMKNWHSYSATTSHHLEKIYLCGGTVEGHWTNRVWSLCLKTLEWTELCSMTHARRRTKAVVVENLN